MLASKDEALLVGRDALLVLDLSLDCLNGVSALDLERDGFASQCFDENLHGFVSVCAVSERRLYIRHELIKWTPQEAVDNHETVAIPRFC